MKRVLATAALICMVLGGVAVGAAPSPGHGGPGPDDDSADDDAAVESGSPPAAVDGDGDGYCEQPRCADRSLPGDCNDADPAVWPGAPEVPYDAMDQDCDGADLMDVDGDGHRSVHVGGGDCDDADPEVHPAVEKDGDGDGIDDDCDGDTDEDDPPEDPFACTHGGGAGAAGMGLTAVGLVLGRRRR